jgi:uncharacterized coiled-coil DUF342 family protein
LWELLVPAAIRKRWKSVVAIVLAVLPSIGWAGREIYCAYKECNDLKAKVIPKVDATVAELKDVRDEQKRRTEKIEQIPVIVEILKEVREQSRENGRDIKEMSAKLGRLEGKFEKAQAMAKP